MRCLITRRQPAPVEGAPRPADGPKPTEKAHDTSDNANSSAWLVEFGAFRFFDAGDLTWNVEASLVWPEIRVPEVDVYQVTHHGLDVSNHPRLLAALNPAVSVMNNGPTKGTAGEVLATLRALPGLQAQYQLHRNARPDGATNNCPHDFIANPSRPEGRTIRCSVSPDGRRYRVSLPGSGVARGYAVRR
jgi:hypothetical protein